jgi:hypothetical protein
MEQAGKWSFIIGLLLSFGAVLVSDQYWTIPVLAVLGVIVGFMNVTSDESNTFLIAGIALIMSATALETFPLVGEFLTEMIANVVAFLVAAVLVVAIKAIVSTAKD